MWHYPDTYDVIVVGAGHAGCEAAHASAKMGARTLLLTMSLDTIAKMSCNPAIGGTAKGHIVREIDALGGIMGKVADRTGIQFRMLNKSKGPAVWSPRAQSDKLAYQTEMRCELEKTANLECKQGTIEDLLVENGKITGVLTSEGIIYPGKSVIISSGTFMRGLIHIGEKQSSGGRLGDKASKGLSKCLEDLGFTLERLKTGTPARIHSRSIDYSVCEEQPGDEGITFSHDQPEPKLPQVSCWITYTNDTTKQIVLDNIHRSPLYSGVIQGVGPRYCPAIEDKYMKFPDKPRHQIFLEPEGLTTSEIYVNGLSTSLPFDVQLPMIRSVPGLENAEVMRPGYAIEYDYVISGQISATLETKTIEGLYFAGQINGTTGYEEAAGQGLIAAINAVLKLQEKEPFILKRSESYIGVMIDELITKTLDEPYRMFTSRAEHRLLLRQDNADLRLREYGYQFGIVSQEKYDLLQRKKEIIRSSISSLSKTHKQIDGKNVSLAQLLRRPETTYQDLVTVYSTDDHGHEINKQIEIELKYEGYIQRQQKEAEKLESVDNVHVPVTFDFEKVLGLRNEARDKLLRFKPTTLGQASRILGVTHADVSILRVALSRKDN